VGVLTHRLVQSSRGLSGKLAQTRQVGGGVAGGWVRLASPGAQQPLGPAHGTRNEWCPAQPPNRPT